MYRSVTRKLYEKVRKGDMNPVDCSMQKKQTIFGPLQVETSFSFLN